MAHKAELPGTALLGIIRQYAVPLTLAIVLLLAAYLRLRHLATDPPALSQDEIVNGYDAFSIGHTLRDHHGTFLPRILGSFGDSASVTLTYLTVPFVVLGGLTEEMVRLPIALTGVASALLLYLLLVEITKDKKLGLLGAFILAVSPWNITLTRWAVPPTVVPFFLLLFLWLFTLIVYRPRSQYYWFFLIGASLAAAGLTYSYPSAEILGPIFVIVSGGLFLFKQWRRLIVYFLTYGALVLPLFYLIVFQPSSNFSRFAAVKIQATGWAFYQQAFSHYFGYFTSNFYFGPGSKNDMMHVPGVGNFFTFLLIPLLVAVAILGVRLYQGDFALRRSLKQPLTRKILIFIFIWLILAPGPAAISIDEQHMNRAILMFPLVTIGIVASLYYSFRSIPKGQWRNISIIFVVVGCLWSVIGYEHIYYGTYLKTAAIPYQYGIKQGVQYALAHQDEYQKVTIDLNINQPYIYYLFYAKYSPKALDYSQTNFSFHRQRYAVPQIGTKYYFTPVTEQSLIGATRLGSIRGYGHNWIDISAIGNRELIIRKVGPGP